MTQLLRLIQVDPAVRQATAAFSRPVGTTQIYGAAGSVKSAVLAAGFQEGPATTVIICADREAGEQLRNDLAALLPGLPVYELPAMDVVTFSAAAKSVEIAARRMEILGRMLRGEPGVFLAAAEAAIQKVIPRADFLARRLTVAMGERLDLGQFLSRLVRFGYERVDQVDGIGQFSVRGGIVDVFPVNRESPLRFELFDDEVDSLREFDPASQRTLTGVDNADILPVTEPEQAGRTDAFLTFLPAGGRVVWNEPARVREQVNRTLRDNPELRRTSLTWPELATAARPLPAVAFTLMLQKVPGIEPTETVSVTARTMAPFHRQMDLFTAELRSWLERKYAVLLFVAAADKAKAVQASLAAEGIDAALPGRSPADETLFNPGPGVFIVPGVLSGGFELPYARAAVVAEIDIFGRQKKKRSLRAPKDQQIGYFREINVGDYVVHVNHGIGKYVGVETLEVAGVHRDYLHIRYAGEDKLYVPTDQVNLLQKYIGSEGEAPRLSRMGGADWLKAKVRAKAAVADLARDLVALYAERQVAAGFSYEPDTPWQREFEDAFPFEETPDQLAAVDQIKADMESPRPMDRLLCGDVGFGKTEVAVRAAFKAIMNGKQVAVLVPTTVLAQQHFQTFSSRFAGFGPTVDVLSRFRSPREQRQTAARTAEGRVDVLIGTHRLLQSDITFKNLGLLIVDEEQRFGVAQKERIKRWRTEVDVLTLSATPIPRTLHMSLVGLRDMSIIETPPEDRHPVQTYVVEYHEEIVRDAIRRELKRGGQVYFVHNRVQSIDKVSRTLAEALPDARIRTAHGQMPEELLEQVMLDFYEGKSDVLVCTSIIENGLDVPNANTIIVHDADRFGLSQLYQMRGRVGRSARMAFAYFTYRRDKVLTEVAEKRLQAIKEFAELGAGFKIAMRDLEIRGAGNLLGAQQHGHIVAVGFEMYCRLLDEAVGELQGGRPPEPPPEPVLELNVEAYLSGGYIDDAMHKIEIYQRIAAARNEEHVRDLTDELIDRFGEPPAEVVNLLTVARIRNACRKMGIKTVVERPDGRIELIFGDRPNIDIGQVLELKARNPGRMTIQPGPPETIVLKTARLPEPPLDWLAKVLAALAQAEIAGTNWKNE